MPVSERGGDSPPARDGASFVIPEGPPTDKGVSQPPQPSVEPAPLAPPTSTAPAPVLAPDVKVAEQKEVKKDDAPKPPGLDPKYKKLPFVVFGAFAIIAFFEIVIAAATSKPDPRDPAG